MVGKKDQISLKSGRKREETYPPKRDARAKKQGGSLVERPDRHPLIKAELPLEKWKLDRRAHRAGESPKGQNCCKAEERGTLFHHRRREKKISWRNGASTNNAILGKKELRGVYAPYHRADERGTWRAKKKCKKVELGFRGNVSGGKQGG